MKKLIIFLIFLILLARPVHAGIGLFEGSVSLSALETKTTCNLIVYSTINGNLSYQVSYTQDISRFIGSIQPNDFYLKSIDDYGCPQDGDARRDCIKNLCAEGKDEYCRIICTTFSGPFEVSMNPQPTRYSGAIKDVVRAGAATITDAQPFVVYYTPYDLKLVILYIIIVIVLIVLTLKFGKRYFKKSKTRKGR